MRREYPKAPMSGVAAAGLLIWEGLMMGWWLEGWRGWWDAVFNIPKGYESYYYGNSGMDGKLDKPGFIPFLHKEETMKRYGLDTIPDS
jgi:hypothetical protein